MKIKDIKNTPFKMPVKTYYLGKVQHGTPYFWPIGFNKTIINVRKLKLRTEEELEAYFKRWTYHKESNDSKFTNLPMVRRSKNWVKKIFNNYYYIEIGWPIKLHSNELGWKDKYDSPRFEWSPAFMIFFFKWQFCIWWNAPNKKIRKDTYWEMLLWYMYYADKDIKKAEDTWPWRDGINKISTWDKDNLKS